MANTPELQALTDPTEAAASELDFATDAISEPAVAIDGFQRFKAATWAVAAAGLGFGATGASEGTPRDMSTLSGARRAAGEFASAHAHTAAFIAHAALSIRGGVMAAHASALAEVHADAFMAAAHSGVGSTGATNHVPGEVRAFFGKQGDHNLTAPKAEVKPSTPVAPPDPSTPAKIEIPANNNVEAVSLSKGLHTIWEPKNPDQLTLDIDKGANGTTDVSIDMKGFSYKDSMDLLVTGSNNNHALLELHEEGKSGTYVDKLKSSSFAHGLAGHHYKMVQVLKNFTSNLARKHPRLVVTSTAFGNNTMKIHQSALTGTANNAPATSPKASGSLRIPPAAAAGTPATKLVSGDISVYRGSVGERLPAHFVSVFDNKAHDYVYVNASKKFDVRLGANQKSLVLEHGKQHIALPAKDFSGIKHEALSGKDRADINVALAEHQLRMIREANGNYDITATEPTAEGFRVTPVEWATAGLAAVGVAALGVRRHRRNRPVRASRAPLRSRIRSLMPRRRHTAQTPPPATPSNP